MHDIFVSASCNRTLARKSALKGKSLSATNNSSEYQGSARLISKYRRTDRQTDMIVNVNIKIFYFGGVEDRGQGHLPTQAAPLPRCLGDADDWTAADGRSTFPPEAALESDNVIPNFFISVEPSITPMFSSSYLLNNGSTLYDCQYWVLPRHDIDSFLINFNAIAVTIKSHMRMYNTSA